MFRIFIYGTLRSDASSHHLLKGKFAQVRPAKVSGKLYLREFDQIPFITVSGKYILARGSRDYGKDFAAQEKCTVPDDYLGIRSGEFVHGELYDIADFKTVMSYVDLYEDYSPGHESEYDRVLYPVYVDGDESPVPCWLYTIAGNHAEPEDLRILDGYYDDATMAPKESTEESDSETEIDA